MENDLPRARVFNTAESHDDEEEEMKFTRPVEQTVRTVERPVTNRVIKTSMKTRPVAESNSAFEDKEAQKQKEKETDNHIKVGFFSTE